MSLKNLPNNKNSDLDHMIERKGNLKSQRNDKKLNEKEKSCKNKHDLNFFSKILNNSKNKYKFCLNCNGLYICNSDKKIFKTISYLEEKATPNYFNPYLTLIAAKKTYSNENLNYTNCFLKYRREMINFVQKLKNKYRASTDSFFLTIRLIDIVCSKMDNFDIDIELISIGCFFLACKI